MVSNASSNLTVVPRAVQGLGQEIDIEISGISARNVINPHKLQRIASFYLEVLVEEEAKRSRVAQSHNNVVSWDKSWVLKTTLSSDMIIRMYCNHTYFGADHIVGEASLKLEGNKDIEIELQRFSKSANKNITSAYITLRVKVALSINFEVLADAEMDFRSSAYLRQMEGIVGSISSEGLKKLSPAWIQLFNLLNTFSSLAKKVAELDSRAQTAVGAMASAIKVLVDQMKRDERVDRLGVIMCDLYNYVVNACSIPKIVSYEKTLKDLLAQTAECAYFVSEYQKIMIFAQRAVVNLVSNADTMISNFETAFGELKIELILGSTLQTNLVSYRILQTVERIEDLIQLNRLPILRKVGWDSTKVCLRGTREKTIQTIVQWASQSSEVSLATRVYLLSGPAACGKSTIAHSVAKVFHEQHRLGAAVFLNLDVPEALTSQNVSSTIIHQLAAFDTTLKTLISEKIKDDPSLMDADIFRQFRSLVVDTTSSSGSNQLSLIGPILIVIDHLHLVSTEEEQSKVLTNIAHYSTALPSNFRFLLTCDIEDFMYQRILRISSRMHVIGYDDANGGISVSLEQHITQSLEDIFCKRPGIAKQYTVLELQDEFKKRARGMHFWVSTAYRAVLAYNEDDSLLLFFKLLFSNPPPLSNNETRDQLYDSLCKVIYYLELGRDLVNINDIMIPRPMQLSDLRLITRLPWESQGPVVEIAKRLGLIIEASGDDRDNLPFGAHLSFEDFLTNLRRFDRTVGEGDQGIFLPRSIAEACLNIMEQNLQCNICRLDNIMVMNREITDKTERITRYFPRSLQYACCNWIFCLVGNGGNSLDDALRLRLETFMTSHILHWIEAMSILDHFDDIEPGLFHFLRWLQAQSVRISDILYVYAADAIRLVKSHSILISKATLQIYVSALPLMPPALDSAVHQQAMVTIPPIRPITIFDVQSRWNVDTQHHNIISSSCSHGALVSLIQKPGGLVIWDARIKTTIECKLKVGEVDSMAFSPDHQTLLTIKSHDVIVYNAHTGARVHYFETDLTNALISYSNDCSTILLYIGREYEVWNAPDGTLRHSGILPAWQRYKIALSPDGRHLAVASEVGIMLVNTVNGEKFKDIVIFSSEPDKRSWNNIIAWSPDGSHLAIASGSQGTVYLWSLNHGKCWTRDREISRIMASRALSFSPDSSLLLYTESDESYVYNSSLRIRIWNTETGMLIVKEDIDTGRSELSNLSIEALPDGQKVVVSTDTGNNKCLTFVLSDSTPAYMTNPPIFHDFKAVPTMTHTLSNREPSRIYASTVDADGWIVNSEGERFLMAPYPNFIISTSYPSPTTTFLEIKHPKTKKTVLNYVFKWGDNDGHGFHDNSSN